MRYLIVLTVFSLFLISAKPSNTPVPVTLVFIVPAGYTPAYDPDQASLIVQDWAARTQAWYARETGKTVNVEYFYIHSIYTLQDYQGQAEVDACGMGADWGRTMNRVVVELENLGHPFSLPSRHWVVLAGGGGWAGGAWYGMNPDAGRFLLGDWELQEALGFTLPEGCGAGQTKGYGKSFGHETLNAMGSDPYNPSLFLDDAFSDRQRRMFLRHNKAFLRSP